MLAMLSVTGHDTWASVAETGRAPACSHREPAMPNEIEQLVLETRALIAITRQLLDQHRAVSTQYGVTNDERCALSHQVIARSMANLARPRDHD